MITPVKPLGKIIEFVESSGFKIEYAYDDLVFSDHSLFILRFDAKQGDKLYLYINSDCEFNEAEKIAITLLNNSLVYALNIIHSGSFTITQLEDKEELEITFMEKE